jgi:hypothetical protein
MYVRTYVHTYIHTYVHTYYYFVCLRMHIVRKCVHTLAPSSQFACMFALLCVGMC